MKQVPGIIGDINDGPHPYKWQVSFSTTDTKVGRKIVGSRIHVAIRLVDPAYGVVSGVDLPSAHRWEAPDIKVELAVLGHMLAKQGFIGIAKSQPNILYDTYYNVVTGVGQSEWSSRALTKMKVYEVVKHELLEYLTEVSMENGIGVLTS